MSRKPTEFINGLALFLCLWAVVYAFARLKLFIPMSVLEWLSQSPYPNQAVISFSAMMGSIGLGILRLGVEFPSAKPLLSSDRVRSYAAGLPVWFIISVFALSVMGLFAVFPSCQAPASAQFIIEGKDPLQPGDTYNAKVGEKLVVTAKPVAQNALLSCRWQYVGDAFPFLGSSVGCSASVELSRKPGVGYLTVQASQDFCSQSSIFSLIINVEP